MQTGMDELIYSRNSFHDSALLEATAFKLDYYQNITMDDAASEFDNTMIPSEVDETNRGVQLELRHYQLELAENAVKGNNSIVVAPTGSGKTHVALYIAKCHLEAAEIVDDPKVVFLVPTVSLVHQQKDMFRKYLSKYKTVGVSGDSSSPQLALAGLVPNYDIFVITPQILLDAIKKDDAEIDISKFTLLIFDECHHTDKGHPYNKVMAHYMDKKLEGERNLPQVVGLTASVGVGKAKDLAGAVTHILKLCANMDAMKLSTVIKNRQQLLKFTHQAKEGNPVEVPGRKFDPFKDEICKLMRQIERKLSTAPELPNAPQMTALARQLVAPSDHGSERYTQWVNSLTTPVTELRDPDTRRLIVTCINHLKMYNEALYISADCQIQDALEYVLKAMEVNLELGDETEEWLNRIFKESEADLKKMADNSHLSNPKLDSIRDILLEFYKKDRDSRGIIFCRTRATTVALERWMKARADLRPLNPKRLVAANAPTDKGGMVQSEQDEALKLFRDGHHKLIIATSVAEEGLDVQACNFVLRYEHVTNETARIQARGRARKPGAEYILVTELGRGAAQRDEINRMREDLMNDAIRRIDIMPMADFSRSVRKHQQDARLARQLAMLGERRKMKQRSSRQPGGLHSLLCTKCSTLVCLSSDIRRVEDVHHVVIDDKLKMVANMRKYSTATKYGEFDTRGKLTCRKCHIDWGVVAHYNGVLFPVLKLTNFVLEDENGHRKCYKKWKEVPFTVDKLTPEDLLRLEDEDIELVQW